MKYYILNNAGEVVNAIIADPEFMLEQVPDGNYREAQETSPVEPVHTIYSITMGEVTAGGLPAPTALSGDYDINPGDAIQIVTSLVNGESVDYGAAVLKVPLVRFADGENTKDEIYLRASIVAGVMTTTGTVSSPGNWRLTAERVNSALEKVGADWRINEGTKDVGFLA